jgi:hypothetical protein
MPVPFPEFDAGAAVDAHGVRFRAAWWVGKVPNSGWTDHLLRYPADERGRGYQRISRADLCSLAERGPWSPAQYDAWLTLAHEQASQASQAQARPVRADAVEKAYFRYGRRLVADRR